MALSADDTTFTEDAADEPRAVDPEDLKAAALRLLAEGHKQAETLMAERHEEMSKARRLYSGRFAADQSTDSQLLNQLYIPRLAEYINFSIASELQQLMPDPQTMDFVSVTATWPGLEEDAKKGEAMLRQKMRIMRTGDGTLYHASQALMQDLRVCGNMVGVVLHDFFGGDLDGDEVSEGPYVDRVSPLNWFPWSRTVGSAAACAHTIVSILTEDEAERTPYLDVAELREKHKPQPVSRHEPAGLFGDQSDEITPGPSDSGWKRIVYFGPLPWRSIAEEMGREDWTREDVAEALRGVYDFDPDLGERHWWVAEWTGDYLISFRPYALALPAGCGPVLHQPFFKVNDELVGEGVYDRMGWFERQYNEFNRYLTLLAGFAAQPPVVENDSMLDEDWLAEHEGQPTFLLPGERIRLKRGLSVAGAPEPFKLLDMGVGQKMAEIREQMAWLERVMEGGAASSGDYTGRSSAKTATQAMNNLSQNKSLEGHYIKLAENGWFLELAQRCYVLMRQVVRLRGGVQEIPVGADQRHLELYEVSPEAIRSLSYYMITVDGSTAPSNRVYQIQQLEQLFSILVSAMGNPQVAPQIKADIQWLYLEILEMMAIRGRHKAVLDQPDFEERILNVESLLGRMGMSLLGGTPGKQRLPQMLPEPPGSQGDEAMGGFGQLPGAAPLTPNAPMMNPASVIGQ